MDAKEVKFRLDMAIHNLNGCEAHLQRSSDISVRAKAAPGSHRQHKIFRGRYGDNYLERCREDFESALREYHAAKARFKEAEADYKRVTGTDPE